MLEYFGWVGCLGWGCVCALLRNQARVKVTTSVGDRRGAAMLCSFGTARVLVGEWPADRTQPPTGRSKMIPPLRVPLSDCPDCEVHSEYRAPISSQLEDNM